ncbi:hypothetical protein GCM10007862_05270 [Dyella lipolytica]|uniref:Glycine zipper 2TM domain-containing protein n=1 Tax=Dyella lipolytica TaxID=1867835 RepID=A0ABW8IYY1_9GAMM|nr:glycine zipper 2TM domain-containing protein [Dyella lipolytica]GLQ45476.1 hypothetical protein GCM10007862_05270 [Dyella lipolytica]
MTKLALKALCISVIATFALGLAACSKQASFDAGTAGAAPAASVDGAAQATQPAQSPPPGSDDAQYAQVVSVAPVRQAAGQPQQVCHDEVVTRKVPPKDEHRIAGTAIGAVAGGLLGHMIGSGKGNTLATVAGAVGGGYAGNRIEASRQEHNVQSTVVHRCTTVESSSSNIVGYDVTYVYNGVTRTTRMDHDPGNRVRVEQGVMAVSDAH